MDGPSELDAPAVDTARYGDFLRRTAMASQQVRYGDLLAVHGGEPRAQRIRVTPGQTYRILRPYVSVRFIEQARSVLPLAVYLVLFQLLVLHQPFASALTITGGILGVIVGLMLFMEGLKHGLMPFAETIGAGLPAKARLRGILAVAFVIGLAATFAEPAIGILQAAGASIDPTRAPLLLALLTRYSFALVLAVGAGVGIATVLGTVRLLRRWSLKPFIYASLAPALLVTAYAALEPSGVLLQVVGLAWDCGGVTTGPVTVPLVLALGIGVAASAGKDDSGLSGFGIVTLASLWPVLFVLLLGIGLFHFGGDLAMASVTAPAASGAVSWHEHPAVASVILALRAILPLVLILLAVLRFVLKERLAHRFVIGYGITLCVIGMAMFNLGIAFGLGALGEQVGLRAPAAFRQLDEVRGSPLYSSTLGQAIAVLFAFCLGFGATLAEPALNALGITVENLTGGALARRSLLFAVSGGVGVGIALGVAKIVWGLPLCWILIGGYLILFALTHLASERYVNVAWDSAGVTTGPVTVPLVVAVGLGMGKATAAVEGFGILAMASLCPIAAVLAVGLIADVRATRRRAALARAPRGDMEETAVSAGLGA